jgi:hypothetical protein
MPEPLASQSHPGRPAVNRLPPFALRLRLQGWEWFRRALKLLSEYVRKSLLTSLQFLRGRPIP